MRGLLVSERAVSVASSSSGRISALNVDVSQRVESGQRLFTLRHDDIVTDRYLYGEELLENIERRKAFVIRQISLEQEILADQQSQNLLKQGIKIFARENARLRTWQDKFADSVNSGIRLDKLNIWIRFANTTLLGTENVLLILIGGFAVMNGELSIGMLVAYLSFKDQFYSRVFSLMDSLFEFKLLDVHLSRLGDILLHDKESGDERGALILPGPKTNQPCLMLNDLGFRFSATSEMLFRHVNLQIHPGETVAIVGPTGQGKTTLLEIILGLYHAEEGSISYHGRNLREIGLQQYRQKIAAVMQDDCLLSGSILENVTFFDQEPDIDFARQCCRLAALEEEVLQMPMQYETPVGNAGDALSGGQIQRLLLARAFYKKPELLVLDEACSDLDLDTERTINAALQQLDVTRIIVAHRPQSFMHADRVYLFTSSGLRQLGNSELQDILRRSLPTEVIVA